MKNLPKHLNRESDLEATYAHQWRVDEIKHRPNVLWREIRDPLQSSSSDAYRFLPTEETFEPGGHITN
jgi:hypothetical protein